MNDDSVQAKAHPLPEAARQRQGRAMSNLIGMKFHRLTALRLVNNEKPGTWYEWLCECGNTTEARGAAVKYGAPKSCGCLNKEAVIAAAKARRNRITKTCLNCGASFEIPPCRDWREHCCSSACKQSHRAKQSEESRLSRKRNCLICGSVFFPRQTQIDDGGGKYCTAQCASGFHAGVKRSPETVERLKVGIRNAIKEGRMVHKAGPDSPRWKGGALASRQRRQDSGKAREYVRAYRKANPDKVREFVRQRRGKKTKRLPRGTIPRIREYQKNRCAICCVSLKHGDHVDHIMPLSKGGEHEPANLQLLCPTCNVRKSAKDPIDYMQERGFLL